MGGRRGKCDREVTALSLNGKSGTAGLKDCMGSQSRSRNPRAAGQRLSFDTPLKSTDLQATLTDDLHKIDVGAADGREIRPMANFVTPNSHIHRIDILYKLHVVR